MNKTIKKLTVIGLGGVGGYFGFKLAQRYSNSEELNVSFVARGETYTTVKEKGLTLLSPEHENPIAHPAAIYQQLTDIPTPEVLLICVKEYDLEKVCLELKDKVNAHTVMLPLMNGVDIYERIRKVITNGIVLPACVYVASHIKEKGIVEHKGNAGKIVLGNDPQNPAYDAQELVDLMKSAGIDIQYKTDAFPDIWTKFFFIASFGLVSARYSRSIGQIIETPELQQRASLIMEEIKAIAIKKNIQIPAEIIANTFQKAATFPYATPTSLQLDVQAGKEYTELELFAGAIMDYGKSLGLPVLESTRIYEEIKAGLIR
ncbi:ketopantoate reductase family protein [Pedobacter gandavensis]|uniref:2-dehydropantoate 2-reductase n=1 Tax=Pedobacter gandavensis TaxID=2679963 RepID=A0ABR6F156_9SPHI|nr:2-dehydropantoate 2-reductase [Pedobacter gandavensis]MBB2151268.1 2-dehydropantoate 2-reductase [Pedobacter gandavensis]